MAKPGTVIGWILDEDDRAALLERYPPAYANPVAGHVTLRSDAADHPLPNPVAGAILGHADDGAGVETMVVAIDGVTGRPDGSTYHITWSLADGRRARESNDVLRTLGWTPFADPIPIRLTPGRI